MKKNSLTILLALVAAFTIVCSCAFGVETAAAESASGKAVYTALYGSEVSTLNYLVTSTQWDQTVGANVIDSLVEYNNIGQIIPGLAETWEPSEDSLSWTFHLRKGVKWYDCAQNEIAEVTANDFVAALKYILDPVNESNLVGNVSMIANAEAWYNWQVKTQLEASGTASEDDLAEYADATEITFDEVGVKAVDDYTLVYTLKNPTPYFLSALTYNCFLPAYGPQLDELGTAFGTSNEKMYYCGAYIMTGFEPQGSHTYVKNVNNWDAANIFIDEIDRIYNSEAATIAPIMALRGEVDSAELSNDIIGDWKENNPEMVSRSRAVPDYSYFYAFNFVPKYDESYGPDNWQKAVNNANFRHSIMSAFNREYAMVAMAEVEDIPTIIQNTITPSTFAMNGDGKDFSSLSAFDGTDVLFFDEAAALQYKEVAIQELTEAGVTFPVTMVLTYKSSDTDWENESVLVKQQLEGVLGTDYIHVELYAGPSENFLSETRRKGMYSFMRCNWGADYADPETFTDPFTSGNNYNFMDQMLDTSFTETSDLLKAYYAAVDEAKASVTDTNERYDKFAAAEAMLINSAIVVPYYISPASYQVTKLDIFEGEYASFGISVLRFKYQKLHENFITPEEYEASFKAWKEGLEK